MAIVHCCNILDEKGREYLDKLEFIPNDEVAERIWKKALEIYKIQGDNSPELVLDIVYNDFVPYNYVQQNGSLYYSLGWSVVSQDAHLRNVLERIEGRETEILPFPCLADKDEVMAISDKD